jgi:hypothetical protein
VPLLGEVADIVAVVRSVPSPALLRVGAGPEVERVDCGAVDTLENGPGGDLSCGERAAVEVRGR